MQVECVYDREGKDGELVWTNCGMYLAENAVTPSLRLDAASGTAKEIASILALGKRSCAWRSFS